MILIIDHFDSFSFNLYQALAVQDQTVVERCDEIELADIENLNPDLVVLSPGPRGPKDTGITLPYLRSALGQTQPTLGICLGFQAMGLIWEAPVEHADSVVHGKTLALDVHPHPIFRDCPNPMTVARYHSLCIPADRLPDSVDILGRHGNMAMAVRDRERPWIGLQFHPESFLTPQGPTLLRNVIQHLCPQR